MQTGPLRLSLSHSTLCIRCGRLSCTRQDIEQHPSLISTYQMPVIPSFPFITTKMSQSSPSVPWRCRISPGENHWPRTQPCSESQALSGHATLTPCVNIIYFHGTGATEITSPIVTFLNCPHLVSPAPRGGWSYTPRNPQLY